MTKQNKTKTAPNHVYIISGWSFVSYLSSSRQSCHDFKFHNLDSVLLLAFSINMVVNTSMSVRWFFSRFMFSYQLWKFTFIGNIPQGLFCCLHKEEIKGMLEDFFGRNAQESMEIIHQLVYGTISSSLCQYCCLPVPRQQGSNFSYSCLLTEKLHKTQILLLGVQTTKIAI